MMENKICCFAGHSSIADKSDLSVQIYEKCEKLICQCGVKTFWVGNYGSFDTLAAGIDRKLKSKYSDIKVQSVYDRAIGFFNCLCQSLFWWCGENIGICKKKETDRDFQFWHRLNSAPTKSSVHTKKAV